jgi:hypothetical protein
MGTVLKLTMIDAMPLQNIRDSSVDPAQILIGVTLRKEVTTLADYCRTFFLDIV